MVSLLLYNILLLFDVSGGVCLVVDLGNVPSKSEIFLLYKNIRQRSICDINGYKSFVSTG